MVLDEHDVRTPPWARRDWTDGSEAAVRLTAAGVAHSFEGTCEHRDTGGPSERLSFSRIVSFGAVRFLIQLS